jgi:uncharacterized membrane protein
MSQTYAAAVVVVLAQLLPLLGIEVSTEALTTTLSTIITIVAGVVIMYRRLTKGDISAFGVRK